MSLASQLSFLESSTSTIQQINNNIVIAAGANASSTTTGALQIVNGGLAVGGSIFVGGIVTATTFVGAFAGTITGTATTATNVAAGTAGQLHYQSAPGTTAFVGTATTGNFLQANYVGAPTWTTTASIYVNSAVSSEKLYAGTAMSIVYQSAANTTAFLAAGTGGYLLQTNGTGSAPSWVAASGLSAANATNLSGGNAWQIPYQSAPSTTLFANSGTTGQFWQATTNGAPTWTGTASMYVNDAVKSTNLRAGTAGQLHYQSAADTTAFISTATTGNFLQANFAGAPTWTTTASMYVNSAVNVQNIYGGVAGSIPIQTAAGATSFVTTGTSGYVLTMGTNAASWQAPAGITAGNATTATNIAGGTAGQIPYQTGAGLTSFFGAGTFGQFLMSTGANAPVYQSTLTQASGNIIITSNTAATSTTTGALQVVNGGVGIGGNLYVGGEIVATKLTIQLTTVTTTLVQTDDIISTYNYTNATSTITGALQVAGGAGIGRDLYVGGNITVLGTINASITGVSTTATNIAGGTAGQLHYQTGPGATGFAGPGTAGQILVSAGTSAPTYTNTASIYVGRAVIADSASGGSATATSIAGGNAWQIPYQSAPSTTLFASSGTTGQFWQANTNAAPAWTTTANIYVANAVAATNLRAGTAMSIHYQSAADTTAFLAAGTAGFVLSTNGTGSAPSWIAVGSVTAGTSTQVQTVAQPASGTYYPAFVSANNASATAMSVYTTSSFSINPATGLLTTNAHTVNGALTVTTAGYIGSGTSGDVLLLGSSSRLIFNAGTTNSTIKHESASGTIGIYGGNQTTTGLVVGAAGVVTINAATASVSAATGALVVSGGVGVGGAMFVTGNFTTTGALVVGATTPGAAGSIQATNEITAYFSDRRLKENVQVIDNALVKVLSLTGITYTPNELAESFGYDRTQEIVGLFADEVNAVLPQAVKPAPFDRGENGSSKSGENYLTVQYEKVVPLLVEAIKEQQATIKTLLSELEDIKKQLGK